LNPYVRDKVSISLGIATINVLQCALVNHNMNRKSFLSFNYKAFAGLVTPSRGFRTTERAG